MKEKFTYKNVVDFLKNEADIKKQMILKEFLTSKDEGILKMLRIEYFEIMRIIRHLPKNKDEFTDRYLKKRLFDFMQEGGKQ